MNDDEVFLRADDPEANCANALAFAERMKAQRDDARKTAEAWRAEWARESGCPWPPKFPWTE